ncbi:MAG: helix-turn-helix domain-containing protein [Trebonia sp.]
MTEGLTGYAALGLSGPRAESAEPEPHAAKVGERVAAARKRAALSGSELGEMVGLRKDQISKIETGRRRLDVAELPRFAAALGVTVRHLLGQAERPALAIAARLATGAGPDASHAARTRARQLFEIDDLLTQVAHMPSPRPSQAGRAVRELASSACPDVPLSKSAAQRQGRELATLTRRELDLGSDALVDLAALMEQHFAVDVALSPLGTNADGLCVHSGAGALILASSDFSEGHVRFTLAHELAHHILGDPREIIEEGEYDMFADNATEWRANAFAGHFLMPERGVRSVLDWLGEKPGMLSERGVVTLMEYFGVSLAALVYQLNVIGMLSFSAGQQVRSRGAASMLAAHRDVAPTGAGSAVRRVRRPPERLVRRAIEAARDRQLGVSVVATLMERPDNEELWDEVMSGARREADDPGITL